MEQEKNELVKKKKNRSRILFNIWLFTIIFIVVRSISTYIYHDKFIWENTKVLNASDFWTRNIIKIVIMLLLITLLYFTRIYELINNFIWGVFSDKEEKKKYKRTKLVVWIIISILLYFFVVPKAINMTNVLSSFVKNIWLFFIHLIPTFLISTTLYFIILFGINHWKKQKSNEDTALDLEKISVSSNIEENNDIINLTTKTEQKAELWETNIK